jgi:methyl-accepting chemotaxis protein
MLVVTSMIIIYTSAMSFFAVSKVESSIRNLEEKNAKIVLKKITLIVNTVYKDLENLKKVTLEHNKNKLRNLTDTIWSVIQTKYEQSKPQNVGIILKKRSQEFKSDLTKFYNDNKDKISERELKKNLINYINIHRYNNGTGYFWVNDFIPNMIVHPIVKELNGKYLGDYKDPNGVYLFTEMVSKVQTNDTGLVRYQWLNPKSKEVEDKISYVFKFEPFNWIIGTGEYYSVLKQRLQKEVITLVNKVKYENNNYFYISDYNNKIISHPYLQGKDFSSIRDINGTLIIPPLINIARQKGEGFHSYWWKMNNSDTSYEKITFAKDFPDWEMVIGTGIYINQIKDEIKKRKKELMSQLREIIKTTKLGKTGYLYIFNGQGEMLIHPNENLDGNKEFSKILTTEGTYIFDDLVKASKTAEKSFFYKWDKPSDKGNYIYEKISWVEYIPKLDLYIGSSVYKDEFRESGIQIRNFVIVLAILILIISFFYSFFFFKNLLSPITSLSKLALKVSNGDYDTRYIRNYKKDEVGILADEFNKMVKTIDNRTKELEWTIKNLKDTQNKLIESEKMASLNLILKFCLSKAMLSQ